jgi:hypothetical protein
MQNSWTRQRMETHCNFGSHLLYLKETICWVYSLLPLILTDTGNENTHEVKYYITIISGDCRTVLKQLTWLAEISPNDNARNFYAIY